jgi:cyclic beta-1,2-glucan synthetase
MMLAWTQAQIQLRHLSIGTEEANLFQSLASHLIYANSALRASSKTLVHDLGSQASLWPLSISGDRPILLVRIDDVEDIELVRQLLQAFEYWKAKGLSVDLVVLNDRMSSYVQDLQGAIEVLVRKVSSPSDIGKVYVLRADLMSPEALRVLPAVARVVLYGRRGDLASQLARVRDEDIFEKQIVISEPRSRPFNVNTQHLEFFNGFGGFDVEGREYVTVLTASNPTPAPWVNVVANPEFGFQSAADGGGYTWIGNSRENKITDWSNDPVSNRPSEVVYIRDEADGVLMSPTLAPIRSSEGTHVARHGFGYTAFERNVHRLRMELLQFVPLGDSIKLFRLRLSNDAAVSRTLTVTFYAEWVLGVNRAAGTPFMTTAIDQSTGALFARNPWKIHGGEQVAFVDMGGTQSAWTGDRREFLGTHGSLSAPRALGPGEVLSNRTGAGMDPCCALQTTITLAAGKNTELVITLGAANNAADAQALIARYRIKSSDVVLDEVKTYWTDTLTAVQVKTPDRSFDIMINGWLLYQTLACRMWARSGFYQASGAYGFRDQLQDSMALLGTRPNIAREHILRAAGRQFVEGDFQHWWLPATGMGVRTRISDDTVWLANCVKHYVQVTGDTAILDERVAFLEGQSLMPGEHDAFFLPGQSDETATLYEHCSRSLDLSLIEGEHGLPLIGTGDWSDGLNRVGEGGKGESVWLGWFLLSTLKDFASIAAARGDTKRLERWIQRAANLQTALERDAWDGRWYRRGFFDDGTVIGSSESVECRIDAIAQSWAVISGGAAPQRAVTAMDESYQQLVRPRDKLMMLFTPPFDKIEHDPGYIKAYPPGIRENGGQYTHGVIWSIFAHAMLGQAARAMELFSMFNPINHARTAADARLYCGEPYVVAADVYSVAPHAGRSGWTWYTGSAGWLHRAGLEAILGVTRENNLLRIKPCVPNTWDEFEVKIQFGGTSYEITLTRRVSTAKEMFAGVEMVSPHEYLITLTDIGGVQKITLPLPETPLKP